MSFKKPGIPEVLKKEVLGKGKKTQLEKRMLQKDTQIKLSNLTIHKDQREATTL